MNTPASGSKNVLNSDVEIKGNLKFSGEMAFDGKIEGDIQGDGTLVLGQTSVVKGNIQAQSAVVHGKVNGNIFTKEKLDIKARSELFGDIRASKLTMEEGVTFEGKAEINPNKISQTPAAQPPGEAHPAPDATRPTGR